MAESINGVGDAFQGDMTQDTLDEAAKHLNIPGKPELMDINDLFEFECQQCGACCMGRTDIILNAYDIYTGAKHLGITPTDFIQKYTIRSLGGQSRIPMITLKCDDKTNMCPFLEFDYIGAGAFKCGIHTAKPGACRSHPIGLMSQCDIGDDGKTKSIKTNFIKVDQCEQSKTGKMQRVGDWMQYYQDHRENILAAHEMSIMSNSILNWREFNLMTTVFTMASERNGKKSGSDMMTQAFNLMAGLLIEYGYAHFDTEKDFSVQCDENRTFLEERFREIADSLLPAMREVFNGTCGMTIEEAMTKADKDGLDQTIIALGTKCTYHGVSMDDEDDRREYGDGDSD